MYDWPEVRAANDRLWSAIRDRLAAAAIAAPQTLTRDADLWAMWQDPGLVLSQTCGMPYRTRLHGHVRLVGTPDFGLPGAPPGYYHSELVVRADRPGEVTDFLGTRLAINDFGSQSGWAAPQNLALDLGRPFTAAVVTGAHRTSAEAVAEGRADLAAIDAVTWRLVVRHLPDLAALLRCVGQTPPTPGLPYITGHGQDAAAIFEATSAAIAGLLPDDAAATGLKGLVAIPAATYLAIPTPEHPSTTPCRR